MCICMCCAARSFNWKHLSGPGPGCTGRLEMITAALPVPALEWPCHILPVLTEEAWGAGTTQPCHLCQARSKGPCSGLTGAKAPQWRLQRAWRAGERDQIDTMGGEKIVYPRMRREALEATASDLITLPKRCWKHPSGEMRFISTGNP